MTFEYFVGHWFTGLELSMSIDDLNLKLSSNHNLQINPRYKTNC